MASRVPLSLAFLAMVVVILTVHNTEVSAYVNRYHHKRVYLGRHHRTVGTSTVFSLCRRTDYPSLCTSSAGPQLRRARSVAPTVLTASHIRATMVRTVLARSLATKLVRSRNGSKIYKANINVCLDNYDDALSNLRDSMKSLRSRGSHADLMNNLSAALTDFTTCDDAFAETPGMRSPLAHANAILGMSAKNNLALASITH
ncbi:hypothetical protein QJS04_geneDACA002775 [Acorus gramineus]|uniref:Pectinesterase inhibitor domain-containing protein n=1 Tax=Acorus gramineus TaxID=55184 RepID=A0AAV9BSV5_ACOGR|nr:hypothetical protein QJS04_geneDACA002775 [Acorus gramineus]